MPTYFTRQIVLDSAYINKHNNDLNLPGRPVKLEAYVSADKFEGISETSKPPTGGSAITVTSDYQDTIIPFSDFSEYVTTDCRGVGFEFDLVTTGNEITDIIIRSHGYGYTVGEESSPNQVVVSHSGNPVLDSANLTLNILKTVPSILHIYSNFFGGSIRVQTGNTLKFYHTPCTFRSRYFFRCVLTVQTVK